MFSARRRKHIWEDLRVTCSAVVANQELKEIRERLIKNGVEAEGGTSSAFAQQVRQEVAKWSKVAGVAGLKK